jgi:hypothetical protein
LSIVRRLERDRLHIYRAKLRRAGLAPVGLNIRLESVQLLTAYGDHAIVRVVDGWAAYVVRSQHGRVVARMPARPHRVTSLALRRTEAGWRAQGVAR